MGTPQAPVPTKFCEACGELLTRKRYGSRLEDRGVFVRRRHCSQTCANTRQDVSKSAHHWRARRHRATTCSACTATTGLHVHHVDRNPANNDPTNLVTLCASCHLKLHWKEDRSKRMATNRPPSRGGPTSPQSADGSKF